MQYLNQNSSRPSLRTLDRRIKRWVANFRKKQNQKRQQRQQQRDLPQATSTLSTKQIRFHFTKTQKQLQEINSSSFSAITGKIWLRKSQEKRQPKRKKSRKRKKRIRILTKPELDNLVFKKFKSIKLINILNKSSYQLTETEHLLLSLGHKFKIPLQLSTSHNSYLWHRSIDRFHRQLNTQLYFATNPDFTRDHDFQYLPKIPTQWTPPDATYSVTLKQYIASVRHSGIKAIRLRPSKPSQVYMHIRATLLLLKQRPDIIIKPADKNLGIVILNKNDYKSMCLEHLNDTTTYKLIESPEAEYQKAWINLQNILIEENRYFNNSKQESLSYFAKSICQLRNSESLRPAQFYCLPKIHKNVHPIPGRPIASAPSTITYHTSIYINNILKPLLPSIPTICQSSFETLQTITTQSFPSTAVICTADVKSLYPSIPITLGLECIQRILVISNKFTTSKIRLIIQLMRWVLTNNFIQFSGDIYLQIEGTAMGTPMAPTYAVLFMYAIERQHLQRALYYKRYIDDIFSVFNSADHFHEFVHAINSVIPERLKLEALICGQEGIFLDIQFKLSNRALSYQLYQKPNNPYAYIPILSDHPRSMFRSFVSEELKRYYRNCSTFTTFIEIALSFRNRLKQRGYPFSIFKEAFNTLLAQHGHHPMNILNSTSRNVSFPHQQAVQQPSLPALGTPHTSSVQQKIKSNRTIDQPILIIKMPVINHSINWRTFINIPDNLRDTLAFQLAFKSPSIIICKCSPRALGYLYISSKF